MGARLIAGIACSLFAAGCGGSSTDNCSGFSGDYTVTTEIVSTSCGIGLHAITQPVTWHFVQTAPSCSFTMTNSLYAGSQYSGSFMMEGTQAKITWTSVVPAPTTLASTSILYTSEDLTISPASGSAAATVSGSFNWTAGSCNGTTNVCHGAIASGCLTPS